jgi:Arc/MetJ-type ribon-helix-helix transcriptional regulator
MQVSLTPEQEDLVDRLVALGIYASVEEALTSALKSETAFRDWERREVQQGIAAANRGEVFPFDGKDIKRRGRARLRQEAGRYGDG